MGELPVIESISDTARWVAYYRAMETDRRDAHFVDPYARRLAGEKGEAIARRMPGGLGHAWALIVRTKVLDEMLIEAATRRGVDMVVNCAAGLDTRPFRLEVPASLSWVEIDLPPMLRYKEEKLAGESPRCHLERVALDLTDVSGRRALFARLGARARRILVLTEGLLVYLPENVVIDLARDFHAAGFRYWMQDFSSPLLVEMIMKRWGAVLREGNSPFQFAPEDGPVYYDKLGWRALDVRYTLSEARRLGREMRFAWAYRWMMRLAPAARREAFRTMNGYALLEAK